MAYYNSSVALPIMEAYPLHCWKPWKFQRTPVRWWQELAELVRADHPVAEACLREYIDDLAKELGIRSWTSTNLASLPALNKTQLYHLHHFGGLQSVLSRLFPRVLSATQTATSSKVVGMLFNVCVF